jgi:hypothetical protein
MAALRRRDRTTNRFGLVALVVAPALWAAPQTQAANEVVTGVVSSTEEAPRTAPKTGTSGLLEGELVCSSRPADGDCTESIRRDLENQGCAFRRDRVDQVDQVDQVETLYFVCAGLRRDMVEVIDQVCRRLNGF